MHDNSNFDSSVYVFKSIDGGHTFEDPTPVVVDIGNLSNPRRADKCYMKVDASPSSPFKNTVYAVWTSTARDENAQNRTTVRFARRKPGDAGFSDSKQISHAGDMRGPALATGPNGEFYAVWVGVGVRSLLFNASTDGGDTFLPDLGTIDMPIHDVVGSLEGPNAPFFLDGVPRANSFPTIDADRSTGPNRGKVYVAWAETTNGKDTDIFLRRITPRPGLLPSVGSVVRVNTGGSGVDQFFPWLSVDSSSGAVEVAFYDRRDNPGTVLVNMYLARSTDGGASFTENTRISSSSSDPRVQADVTGVSGSAIGIGDYVGMVASLGKAHILWADTRRGKQEIFYSQVDFDAVTLPPPTESSGDDCQSPRAIASLPYLDALDTKPATSALDDPVSCTGGLDTNTVWYAMTPVANTVYGVDASSSDFDTVVSVYTGDCGALTLIACNDDAGHPPGSGTRSVLTFSAKAGERVLIEASGKASGGLLKIRSGYPTITGVEFTSAPDGSDALKIAGAGFVNGNGVVTVQQAGSDIDLPNVLSFGAPHGDGTVTTIFATKKKLKKLVKRGSLLVRVESPAGSGSVSNSVFFTR